MKNMNNWYHKHFLQSGKTNEESFVIILQHGGNDYNMHMIYSVFTYSMKPNLSTHFEVEDSGYTCMYKTLKVFVNS